MSTQENLLNRVESNSNRTAQCDDTIYLSMADRGAEIEKLMAIIGRQQAIACCLLNVAASGAPIKSEAWRLQWS
jgi:hypothetical protein